MHKWIQFPFSTERCAFTITKNVKNVQISCHIFKKTALLKLEGYTSTVLYMNFQKLFLKWNVKSAIADNWNWIKGIPEAKKANEMLYSQQEMKNVNNIVLSEMMVGRNWLQKKSRYRASVSESHKTESIRCLEQCREPHRSTRAIRLQPLLKQWNLQNNYQRKFSGEISYCWNICPTNQGCKFEVEKFLPIWLLLA